MKTDKKITTMRRGVVLAWIMAIAVLFASATYSQAELLRYRFTGVSEGRTTDFPSDVVKGDLISGLFTVDTATPGGNAAFGVNRYECAVTALEVNFGSQTETLAGASSVEIHSARGGVTLAFRAELSGGFDIGIKLAYSRGFPSTLIDLPDTLTPTSSVPYSLLTFPSRPGAHTAFKITSIELDDGDRNAPVVNASVAVDALWSPNHKMNDVGLMLNIQDDRDPTPTVAVFIYSNEPNNGSGDDNTLEDAALGADGSLSLRAERSGNSDGRVYLIIVAAVDAAGNVGYNCTTVIVPKSKSKRDYAAVVAMAVAAEETFFETASAPEEWYPLN